MESWLILGAGYAGARMARGLAKAGVPVWATVRDDVGAKALRSDGVAAVVAAFPQDNSARGGEGINGEHVAVGPAPRTAVLSIPPARGDDAPVEAEALAWAKARGVERVVYWSSTSVYGSSDGATIDETTAVAPDTEVGIRRLAAEDRVRAAAHALGMSLAVVRIVGIYGPHRNLRQRLERGDYALVDGGAMWSNRVHVDDIAHATRHIARQEAMDGVWLLSDGHPFQVRDFVRWNVETLGLAPPPEARLEELAPRARAFWTGNRRVAPARLWASGWRPLYPDWREGTLACWREEGLNV